MAYTHAVGGDPDRTSGYIYSGYIYTGGYGFPGGNPSSTGGNPVRLYSVGLDYLTGGYARIYHGNSGTYQTGGVTLSGGGSFSLEAVHTGGTLYFGRNTGNGGVTVHNEGGSWTGGICGWITWATVPGATTPLEFTPKAGGTALVRFSGNSDGGAGILEWQIQIATNSGFTSGVQNFSSSGTSTLTLTPGQQYWQRSRGRNEVGWGAWSSALSATMLGGGKRWDGANGWKAVGWQRWNGSAWVTVTTNKRWNGTSWVQNS